MSARRIFLAATVALASFAAVPLISVAQDVSAPEVENAKFNFQGVTNDSAVNVRSGPGDNYYPTAKLDKGTPITVVGIRFDWLKVKPPEGSFSYVAKAYVTRSGDGTIGTVDKPDLRVRAGSNLNAMKTTVQTTLNVGDKVTILGEADEYYKITPPANVFLYVNKQFVDAVKPVEPIAGTTVKPEAVATTTTPDRAPVATQPPVATDTTSVGATVAGGPTTQPTGTQIAIAEPTTKPTGPSAEAVFDKLEAEFATMSALSLDQQPLAETTAAYQGLANSELPESLKRIVDLRLATLKGRSESKDQFIALKKSQEEAAARQTALKAEQQELEERIKKNQLTFFTAVGTLRTSSLQQGATTLYRLTDPTTGRTVVYLRSNDIKFAGMLGQFVGVHGEMTTDAQLSVRVITPTDVLPVDQTKINNGVSAQVIPPSLMSKQVSANN